MDKSKMTKAHSSGNGNQMRHLIRKGKSPSKALQAQIDRAVGLADREVGISGENVSLSISITRSPDLPISRSASGLPVAPTHAVPPTPPPEPISVAAYTERIRAGCVPVMGLPGTPITSGFVRDLGEYNPKLEGLNGIWTYQEMRRGDGQVAGTLRACKLPILSAKWEIVPGDGGNWKLETRNSKLETGNRRLETRNSKLETGEEKLETRNWKPDSGPVSDFQFPISSFQNPVSNTGAGRATASKAKEVADFIRANLFSGLEWQDWRGSWHTQNWKDVVRYALRMQDFGAACYEEVMSVDGDRIRARRLCDRQALTFYRWHTDPHSVDPSIPPFIYDDGETLYALEQWGYRSNRFEYVLLPTDKACIFTHDQEGANFWGIPLTRAMYPHWFVKKHLERIDAIACERNSLGVPMIMLPPNPSKQDVQTAQNWVTQLAAHEKTGLSLPNGAEFKLVGIEGRIREILPSLQYHKQQIATSCLAMFMELGQTQSGSRALGDSQTDFFLLATQNTADYIAHQIRNSTIRRLVLWNFGPDAPVPYLVPANVQARSIDSMAAIISQLAQAGAWISDRSSVNQARHELGFEEFADEDVVAIRGETIGTPGGQISGKGGEAIEIRDTGHGTRDTGLPSPSAMGISGDRAVSTGQRQL
jgi:hypothetical protein